MVIKLERQNSSEYLATSYVTVSKNLKSQATPMSKRP